MMALDRLPAGRALALPRRHYLALYLLMAVCIAPVVASYLAYYVFPPAGRSNYGALIEPQRPLPALTLQDLDGRLVDPAQLRGSWTMLMTGSAACDDACRRRLWLLRQLRSGQGKDAERIARVFLVTDGAPLDPALLRDYAGTQFLRADPAQLADWLPLPAQADARPDDHLFLVDPLGNLMLRWPPAADPKGIKRDLGRLLKASRVG